MVELNIKHIHIQVSEELFDEVKDAKKMANCDDWTEYASKSKSLLYILSCVDSKEELAEKYGTIKEIME